MNGCKYNPPIQKVGKKLTLGGTLESRLAQRRLATEEVTENVSSLAHTGGETPPSQPARRQRSVAGETPALRLTASYNAPSVSDLPER